MTAERLARPDGDDAVGLELGGIERAVRGHGPGEHEPVAVGVVVVGQHVDDRGSAGGHCDRIIDGDRLVVTSPVPTMVTVTVPVASRVPSLTV